jgi:hypothetical protein
MSDNADEVNVTRDLRCSVLEVEQALSNLKETVSAWPDSPLIYSEPYRTNMVRHLEDMLSYLDPFESSGECERGNETERGDGNEQNGDDVNVCFTVL